MILAVTSGLRSRRLHIGMDETYGLGTGVYRGAALSLPPSLDLASLSPLAFTPTPPHPARPPARPATACTRARALAPTLTPRHTHHIHSHTHTCSGVWQQTHHHRPARE